MSDTNPAPTPDGWRSVDAYLTETLVEKDSALEHARAAQDAAGLPAIEVVPLTGKLLHLLARMIGARRVLEIGTLGGYSTIWLARAVGEEGRVTTIEAEPRNAAVARRSIDDAGVGARVEIRQGRAAEVLPQLEGPFDLVFIDADKESNTIYLDWAARLGREGTVVVVDNVVRAGRIVDPENHESQVEGVRRSLAMLADDDRFDATAVQTLDAKGWDGFAVALITHPGDSSGGAEPARH
ncbi:O-methyltransferase [Microbacterium sp. Clip185]|uniref:O-methyltransferase n=1 Tax=Microbacterium sp. Clip185 TaxID=3025663 RepID=UPI0023661AC3|nr:O-methyltransferase [Microbacterium sp. Clip185]WDG17050.1 O-methyltransferase [Microbacterium sp. Clip185]